jgi:hypothetical protein
MAKGTPHKKQHWVPQSYLKAWADPDAIEAGPHVWRFSKDGQRSSKKAPKGIFFEEDLYTIHLADGTRDLTVEHGLSGLESQFAEIRDTVLAKRKKLAPQQDLLLRAFIAVMQSRTRANLEHWQGQFKTVLDGMNQLRDAVMSMTPEKRKKFMKVTGPTMPRGESGSYEDVQQVAEGPVGSMVVPMVQSQLPVLVQMKLAVLTTKDDLGFITSDQPCVWFDPEAYKRPPMFRTPGLAFPTIEVTLPASPSHLLLLSWHNLTGYRPVRHQFLDDLNRRTRFYCDEYVICRRNEKRDIWFDPGKPPE